MAEKNLQGAVALSEEEKARALVSSSFQSCRL
jgi:hypothetical protein